MKNYIFYGKAFLARLLSEKCPQEALQSVIGTRSVIRLLTFCNALIILTFLMGKHFSEAFK